MKPTTKPSSGKTTYHRDGTVSVWDRRRGEWVRGDDPPDQLLATLDQMERYRISKHTSGDITRADLQRPSKVISFRLAADDVAELADEVEQNVHATAQRVVTAWIDAKRGAGVE